MSEDGTLKITNVQRIKRANGKVDLYFRKGDYREGPLQSADNTPELKAEVDAIMRRLARALEANSKPKVGTVAGALADYNKDPIAFLGLARSTQTEYQYYIDELTGDIGDKLLIDVTRSWIMELRSAWALQGHRAADNRLQVLKNALSPIIDDETDNRITGDPFHKIKKVPRPHDAGESHPIWEDHEFDAATAYAFELGTPGLARALALARFGGFRRGTICALPRATRITGYDDEGEAHTRLYWITEKRKVLCDKREDARLTAIMNATPNRALTLAYNADGNPWKERQLSQAFDRLMDRLAARGKVRAVQDEDGNIYCPLTLHGLRHTRGVELAEAGASDSEIMTQLEHATPAAAKIYRRQADRRRMADAAQTKVDNVVKLREAKKAKAAANSTGT